MYIRSCNGTAGGRRRHLVRRWEGEGGRKETYVDATALRSTCRSLAKLGVKEKKTKEKREAVSRHAIRLVGLSLAQLPRFSIRVFSQGSRQNEACERGALASPPHAWYATLRLSDNALNYLDSATSSCTPYRACAGYSGNILWFTRWNVLIKLVMVMDKPINEVII